MLRLVLMDVLVLMLEVPHHCLRRMVGERSKVVVWLVERGDALRREKPQAADTTTTSSVLRLLLLNG